MFFHDPSFGAMLPPPLDGPPGGTPPGGGSLTITSGQILDAFKKMKEQEQRELIEQLISAMSLDGRAALKRDPLAQPELLDDDSLVELIVERGKGNDALRKRIEHLVQHNAVIIGKRDKYWRFHTATCKVLHETKKADRVELKDEVQAISDGWLPCPCIFGKKPPEEWIKTKENGVGRTTPPKPERQPTTGKPGAPMEPTVFVTKTGQLYHKDGCSYLRSKIEMPLSQAKKAYSPCSRCSPPR